ncbi:Pyridoxal biosynthesis protein PDX1.3 [Morella rubra]|uniref:pyridoxal 5'-phosphate synthase (glutamine hydrolyzing) n=1 Tax=Morella rubra TaxID=262757 RepID=A0A6A1WN81_9ROSI|nr:Pyridoxal biosynthesis protein PDX1.3 [Morella rubra]
MDVVNAEQARIAEEARACAVMALEHIPADIRSQGGVALMSDPQLIKEIKQVVTILVMAKAQIGHFIEAQILEAISVGFGFSPDRMVQTHPDPRSGLNPTRWTTERPPRHLMRPLCHRLNLAPVSACVFCPQICSGRTDTI